MFDRHGNLTDDENTALCPPCDSFAFDPSPDFDGLEYDDMNCGPKCGGRQYEDSESVGCRGCQHCDPVDPESKPYGFGIEPHEDPALARANAAMWAEVDRRSPKYTSAPMLIETWGIHAGRYGGSRTTSADMDFRNFLWRFWSVQSVRRLRHSEIVWNRLCDECKTHHEAVTAYKKWAVRSLTVHYRDESK